MGVRKICWDCGARMAAGVRKHNLNAVWVCPCGRIVPVESAEEMLEWALDVAERKSLAVHCWPFEQELQRQKEGLHASLFAR